MRYVKVDSSEQVYGKKNLLYSEMEILTLIQHIRAYKKLRTDELALKILLKKKSEEITAELKVLDSLLPKEKYEKEESPEQKVVGKQRQDLELEIAEIQRKIATLSG